MAFGRGHRDTVAVSEKEKPRFPNGSTRPYILTCYAPFILFLST